VLAGPNRAFRDHLIVLGLAIIGIIVVALVAVELLVTRTVKSLVGATRTMAAGELSTRTRLGHLRDELSVLASSFDQMAEALQERDRQQKSVEAELRTRTEELDKRVVELRHLTGILKAIRNVNQLIVAERDSEKLIQSACDLLVTERGLSSAWIVLADGGGKPTFSAVAGDEPTRSSLADRMAQGVCPACVVHAIEGENPLLVYRTQAEHAGCPLADVHEAEAVFVARLEADGRPLGMLGMAIPSEVANSVQEQGLVRELAADIALALRAIENEKARRESEQLYRSVLDLTDAGVVRFDSEGRRTFVNEAFVRRHGKPAEELLKGTIGDQMVPEDAKKDLELLRQCIATSQPVRGFVSRHVKEGRTLHTRGNLTPVRDAAGKVVGVQVTSVDITDMVEAQEALRLSEEFHRSVVETTGANVARFDLEGRRTYVNDSFVKLFGGTMQRWIGGKLGDSSSPEDRQWLWDLFRRCVETATATSGFVRSLIAQGRIVHVKSDVTPITQLDGRVTGVQITSVDVTDLVEAEERSRRAEARYQSLVDSTGGVVIRVDAEGRRTFVSGNAGEFYGVDIEEMRNGGFGDRMLPEERGKALALLQETFRTGVSVHGFVTRQMMKGKPRWISATWVPIKDAEGRVVEVQTTSVDLTEQAEDRERLRESEALYRSLMDVASVGIVRVDQTGRRLFANTFAASLAGRSVEEYLKGTLGDTLQPEERERALLRQVFETGEPATDFVTHVRVGDRTRVVSSNWRPIKDSMGRVAEAQITLVDITRQRELEEEYFQAQRMESVGRLAGGIAHDFNNLLTAVLGYAELALQKVQGDAETTGYIQEIVAAGERSATLVRQLLAFSRRQPMDPKVVDVNTLVRDMEKILRRVIGEDIDLKVVLSQESLMVRVDSGQFEQVLMNLVVNARDAMPHGGKLTIGVRSASPGEPTAGEHVLISLTDTGTGMTEDVKKHLFEPFFTTKAPGRGTGLGLATCYGIVTQNRGEIRSYSELGVGTTMNIYLPRMRGAQQVPTARQTLARLPTGSETVLLVEDEVSVKDLAARALRQQGYTVLTASDGAEALRLVESDPNMKMDMLLTDVVMPEMGGKELDEKLTALRPGLRVVYMSGYPEDAIAHQGELEDGVIFVQKPISIATLVQTVRQVLDQAPPDRKEDS
ncbi:MAG: PAS domain S-box protein, partial [Chloroflexota bacterium]|nr:PAS domain S-box protein [Chloroflexota bacterium]